MSLDLASKSQWAVGGVSVGANMSAWSDSAGWIGWMQPASQPNGYWVGNPDGSMKLRNGNIPYDLTLGQVSIIPDLENDDTFYACTNVMDAWASYQYYSRVYAFDARAGMNSHKNNVDVQITGVPIPSSLNVGTIPTDQPSTIATSVNIRAVTHDRFICVIRYDKTNTGGSHTTGWAMGWWPRDPAAPQLAHITYILPGASGAGPISTHHNPKKFWIASGSVPQISNEYDIATITPTGKTQQFKAFQVAFPTVPEYGVPWWSRRFSAYFVAFPDQCAIYELQQVPASLSAVRVLDPYVPPVTGGGGGPNTIAVTGIKPGSPTVVRTATSISAWLAAGGVSAGAKVTLQPEIDFNSHDATSPYGLWYTGEWGPNHLGGTALAITVIDDNHFSLPMDTTNAQDTVSAYYFDGHDDMGTWGAPGETFVAVYDLWDITQYVAGQKILITDVQPPTHPFNNLTATITFVDDGDMWDLGFRFADVDFDVVGDVTSQFPGNVGGKVKILPDTDGFVRVQNVTADTSRTIACATSVDLSVDPPVITLGNDPTFLDDIGIGDSGSIKLRDAGQVQLSRMTWTITRAGAANKFTIAPIAQFQMPTGVYSMTAASHAYVQTYNQGSMKVGRKFRWDAVGLDPSLNGTISTVASVDAPPSMANPSARHVNYGTLDLDSSALTPWTSPPTPYVQATMWDDPITNLRFVIAKLGGGDSTPPPATTDIQQAVGVHCEVDVLDDSNNGIAGLQVAWTADKAGTFNPATSVTDSNGTAHTVFIVDKAATGTATITATQVYL